MIDDDPKLEHLVFALMPFRHSNNYDDRLFVLNYLENNKHKYDTSSTLYIKFKQASERYL